jgi:hypothetical protein
MKSLETVCIESCLEAEDDRKEKNIPFDDGSFFCGYIYAVRDMAEGKLPQVELEATIKHFEETVAKSKRKYDKEQKACRK